MLTVVTWRWGPLFGPEYVNRLRSMMERQLEIPHEVVCVTDDAAGIDKRVRIVAPPAELAHLPRCRRRLWAYAEERRHDLGARILACDLDVVAVGKLAPIVDRPEPVVLWKVGYARVFSGSFQLFDAGALAGAWHEFQRDPEGFPRRPGERNASDQAMLNWWTTHEELRTGQRTPHWTERDGFVTWFGEGYGRLEQHGIGPGNPDPPPGARLVVLGSADKAVLDEGRYGWVRSHWR